jgi:hypothetical protein
LEEIVEISSIKKKKKKKKSNSNSNSNNNMNRRNEQREAIHLQDVACKVDKSRKRPASHIDFSVDKQVLKSHLNCRLLYTNPAAAAQQQQQQTEKRSIQCTYEHAEDDLATSFR